VTLYWGGLFASRLGYAFLPTGLSPKRIVVACIVGALIAILLLVSNSGAVTDTIAISVLGFASGPIFPSLIAMTPARVGARHTPNAVGMQIAVAAVGVAVLPATCGVLARNAGLEAIPRFLTACWVVLLIAYVALERASRRPLNVPA
jgi:fucose permease